MLIFHFLKEYFYFVHKNGKKGNVTANIYAHNYDLDARKYFSELNDIKLDPVLVSDLGHLLLLRIH